MEKNRPCYDKRIGNIRLAIWENTSETNANDKPGQPPPRPARYRSHSPAQGPHFNPSR